MHSTPVGRVSFPDIETIPNLGDGKFRTSATMTVSKKRARQFAHRLQMRAVCQELGRENYPSRQTMRRVALRMLKDAGRRTSRSTHEAQQRINKNKDWMRFVTDTVEDTAAKAAVRSMAESFGAKFNAFGDALNEIGMMINQAVSEKFKTEEFGMKDLEKFMRQMHAKSTHDPDPRNMVMSDDTFATIANAPDITKMTVPELLAEGRRLGAKVTTKMSKAQLIDALCAPN